jgi:hypothetical protein
VEENFQWLGISRQNDELGNPTIESLRCCERSISLGDLSLGVTRHTFICPFLELLVRGSLLHKIENLNALRSESVVFSRWRPFAPDCSSQEAQEAMLFLGCWDQTFRATVLGVTSRLFDPWSNESADSYKTQPVKRLLTNLGAKMTRSIHAPTSSLALAHSGVIVYRTFIFHKCCKQVRLIQSPVTTESLTSLLDWDVQLSRHVCRPCSMPN